LVKCGIAACGMRKVKCGIECAESYCGMVGNMRNAESCPVGGRMRFHIGCRGGGGGRRIDQNIGLATFVCSSDLRLNFNLKLNVVPCAVHAGNLCPLRTHSPE